MVWRDSSGVRIELGRELGRGGEGAVFDVVGFRDQVAKVYHTSMSPQRAAKLGAMVKSCDDGLTRIAAWPRALLFRDSASAPAGFIMPRLVGSRALHNLYGPRHRKQDFPNANWAFLVHVARNVAAAFYVVHARGHVIGDVNPNVVFVGENGVVRLIDCDSFQIVEGSKRYLCEVGVPIFTPPELQSRKTFEGFTRTSNHDSFGLALLIFHLLLMGRHPFSGVYSGREDMPLEKAIAEYRYAFGRNSALKGMRAPPGSVPPSILPGSFISLFERAFTEEGARARPTAEEWFQNLDLLRKQLRTCAHEPIHAYFAGVGGCPWCVQERAVGVYYFITRGVVSSVFDLGKFWARLESIAPPGPARPPLFPTVAIQARPFPPEVTRSRTVAWVKRGIGLLIILISVAFGASYMWLGILAGVVLLFAKTKVAPEIERRQQALQGANSELHAAMGRWHGEASEINFETKRRELVDLKSQYVKLDALLAQEKKQLHDNRRAHQLHAFLDRYFIDKFDISGIGPGRKATLASFNIETAADVNVRAISGIKGFGTTLTNALLTWRRELESRFVFDPNQGVNASETAILQQRFAGLRRQLEGRMLAAAEELTQIRTRTIRFRNSIPAYLEKAHGDQLQAQADAAVR